MAKAEEGQKTPDELKTLKRRRNYLTKRLKEMKTELKTLRTEKKELSEKIKELKPAEAGAA